MDIWICLWKGSLLIAWHRGQRRWPIYLPESLHSRFSWRFRDSYSWECRRRFYFSDYWVDKCWSRSRWFWRGATARWSERESFRAWRLCGWRPGDGKRADPGPTGSRWGGRPFGGETCWGTASWTGRGLCPGRTPWWCWCGCGSRPSPAGRPPKGCGSSAPAAPPPSALPLAAAPLWASPSCRSWSPPSPAACCRTPPAPKRTPPPRWSVRCWTGSWTPPCFAGLRSTWSPASLAKSPLRSLSRSASLSRISPFPPNRNSSSRTHNPLVIVYPIYTYFDHPTRICSRYHCYSSNNCCLLYYCSYLLLYYYCYLLLYYYYYHSIYLLYYYYYIYSYLFILSIFNSIYYFKSNMNSLKTNQKNRSIFKYYSFILFCLNYHPFYSEDLLNSKLHLFYNWHNFINYYFGNHLQD